MKNSYHSIVAHEMGHAFGLLHSSGPYDETYDSEWDVMSGGGLCSFRLIPEYGYLGVHTIAYHKDFLGWIPPARKYVAPRNSTRRITLERLAQPGAEGYLMAQIPIGDSATDFYTVETRLFAGYDDEIPDEAVVIHKVDTTLRRPAGSGGGHRQQRRPKRRRSDVDGRRDIYGYGKQPPGLDRRGLLKWLPRDHQHQPCYVQHLH